MLIFSNIFIWNPADQNVKLDHYGLLLKLKAAILRCRRDYDPAIRCLNQIFQLWVIKWQMIFVYKQN